MPWFTQGPRARPEEGATIQDLFNVGRVILNHVGGFANTLANMTLTLSRLDARVEGISADLAAMRRARIGVEDLDHEEVRR
jgi:hypothetical protein